MKPRRLLLIVSKYPPLGNAGAERGTQRLARALTRRGCRVTVLTRGEQGLPMTRIEEGVRVCRRLRPPALGPLWGLQYMRQVDRFLRNHGRRFDFVLCRELYLHSAAAAPRCRKMNIPSASLPVLAGERSDVERLRAHQFGGTLLNRALRSDAMFVLSGESRNELRSVGFPKDSIHPYQNFVDDSFFEGRSVPDSGPFVYIGRFHEQKNIPGLIEAFRLLQKERPDATLRIVGDGPERETVESLASESPGVTVHDWTDDPLSHYREAIAVVTATRSEGQSNVLLEAMACGRPVVVTDVSGAREALGIDSVPHGAPVVEGVGGLLVPAGNSRALCDAMKRLHDDYAVRARLGAAAHERATACFSEEASVRDFLRAVESIIKRRAR